MVIKADGKVEGNVTEWREEERGMAAETEDEVDLGTKEKTHKVKVLHYKDDTPQEYEVDNDDPCVKTPLTGQMPRVWSWLENATELRHPGRWHNPETHEVIDCHWWGANTTDEGYYQVCVNETLYPRRPLLLEHNKTNGDALRRYIIHYEEGHPAEEHFKIPEKCQ